jgi:hypothetical protein
MDSMQDAAYRLIDEHGCEAAGEAFLLALEARIQADSATEAHWSNATVEIMHMQPFPAEG